MKSVGIADLKAHLAEHLRAVRRGEGLTILDRREPVARIVPVGDVSAELSVTPAVGRLSDIRAPGPVKDRSDVLESLREERGDRF